MQLSSWTTRELHFLQSSNAPKYITYLIKLSVSLNMELFQNSFKKCPQLTSVFVIRTISWTDSFQSNFCISDPDPKQINFSKFYYFPSPSPKAPQRERQAAFYRRGWAAEEAAQEGLPRLQIPATAPQKRKARFQFRKWGRQPFGGWGQPQPVPQQTCPPGSGPRWGSRVPSDRWAPPSCCRWAAGSLPQTPLTVIVWSVCRGGDFSEKGAHAIKENYSG